MSNHAITWAFDQHDTTPTQRLVLIYLADCSNHNDQAWPSPQTIAENTGLSRASVYRSITELKKAQKVAADKNEDGRDCLTLRIVVSHRDKDSHSETPIYRGTPKNPKEPNGGEEVGVIWNHYLSAFNPRRKEPDAGQRKIIADALKVATAAELHCCITAAAASDWHQKRGEHSTRAGKKHNTLTAILKSKQASSQGPGYTQRERIDFWLDRSDHKGGLTQEERDRIREEWVEARNRWAEGEGPDPGPRPNYEKGVSQ